MRVKLTNTYIANYKLRTQRDEIYDTEVSQLFLRVSPNKRAYYIRIIAANGNPTNRRLGDAAILTPAQARELARRYMVEMQLNGDPREQKTKKSIITLEYIAEQYDAASKSCYITNTVKGAFGDYMTVSIDEITLIEIEKWRKEETTKGVRCITTINLKVAALRTLLNWAKKRKLIPENPLADIVKLPATDSEAKTRYLTDEESERLSEALDRREKRLREERRRTREHAKGAHLPDLTHTPFADYLKPLITVALNTGIRKHALLSLRWEDIDFVHNTITLPAETAKNRQYAVLPMNKTVIATLTAWRTMCPGELVWPSPQTGRVMDNCNSAWERLLRDAQIENFRWHDMRHTFASRLVMAGVDLNTVRELMTHSDIKMTLRYAHLAPSKKKDAVDRLD